MKKVINYIVSIFIISILVTSCEPTDTGFDESLLIGKWKSNTVYYRYDLKGNGVTWDTSDDVTEKEAQAFTWSLDQSTLTHIYVIEIGGAGVPKVYTISKLSNTNLEYKDSFGKSFTFSKVQ